MSQNLVLGGPYERPKKPFKLNTLYTRTWQAPFTNGLTDAWRQRCHEYWERVEQRFGVVFSEPTYTWDDDPVLGPVVMTAAAVLYVMPGERYDGPPTESVH